MGAPSPAQLMALKALFGAVPDEVLLTLDRAFVDGGAGVGLVRDMIAEERSERALRDAVFAPISPLFLKRSAGPSFPRRMLSALWVALRADSPDLLRQAAEESRYLRQGDETPKVFDELSLRVGAILRAPRGPVVREGDEALAADLAAYVDLIPLARKTLTKLPDWLGRTSEERIATLKIALRDGSAMMQDGASRLMEVLMAHLPEPQMILRVIAVATDRSSDRYLADSELARFGERLLEEVDRRVERLRTYDPDHAALHGQTVAEDVTTSCAILAEFERSVELNRDGAWGRRVVGARRAVAAHVEARLRDVEGAVAQALPMQKVKMAGRMTRAAPVIDRDPVPAAVQRARGLLLLVDATRAAAPVGGYGALRATVVEKLRERLDDYADEVLHQINAATGADETRARVWLELAAEFLEHVDGAKSAQLVRRRAAAAGVSQTAQNLA